MKISVAKFLVMAVASALVLTACIPEAVPTGGLPKTIEQGKSR